jgi:ribosomal-protein-alanine N-acetyltransferase
MIDELILRLATRDDAPAIASLTRDRIEQGLGWSWTAPRVMRSTRDHETNVLVARQGAASLGFGIMKYHDDEAHLLLLAVRTECSRRGVGRAMMGWLEQVAMVAGVGQVVLEARASNGGARAFYARLGYREVQQVSGYYQGREACVRLAKDLRLQPADAA